MRGWARLRLFRAGLIAAGLQAVLVVAITPLVLLFAQHQETDPSVHTPNSPLSLVSLLQLSYLACATGVALTRHRYVTSTSTDIRRASRLMSASEPDQGAGTIALCLALVAIGCAGCVLQPPPAILASIGWRIGPHAIVVPILWSALMSICVASFGSNALAAADAFELAR